MASGRLINIGNIKIWSLSYAGDIVLLARTPGEMKDMMNRFEKYIKQKNMLLSPTKSKIVEFRTGRGREKKKQWKWKDQMIEQVKEIKYVDGPIIKVTHIEEGGIS